MSQCQNDSNNVDCGAVWQLTQQFVCNALRFMEESGCAAVVVRDTALLYAQAPQR